MSSLLARLRSFAAALRARSSLEAEMEAEFRHHIELRTEHLIRAGLPPAEAARRARVEFGSTARYREEGREARGLRHLDELRADLRYAARSFRRSPGFTAAALLTLAIGVGANAAVFSLVSASLLRPLPFEEPEGVVVLEQRFAGSGAAPRAFPWWSPPQFEALRPRLSRVTEVAAYWGSDANLSGAEGEPERLRAEIVSASYFDALRVRPALGRAFLPEEDSVGSEPVVLLGHELWQRRFGGDPGVLGERLLLNGVPLTIVGVAPRGFRGLSGDADAWVPHAQGAAVHAPDYLVSDQYFLGVVGRLRPGATLEQARAEMATVGARTAAGVREAGGGEELGEGTWTAGLVPLEEARRDPVTSRARLVLGGVAAFVLLIAIVNLSGLLLARATTRVRETAARAALGAGRMRLLRQGAVEGAVLGLLGGVAGLLLAFWCVRGLVAFGPAHLGGARPGLSVARLASFAEPSLDWRVVLFAGVVALGAGIAAGLLPTLRVTGGDLTRALRSGGRGAAPAAGSLRRPTVLSVSVMVQVACALVLLVGSALLLRGFRELRSVEPGFEPAGVLTFRVSPPRSEYEGEAAARLHERVLAAIHALPGVQSASVGCTPFGGCGSTDVELADRPTPEEARLGWNRVAPDHFRTLGIPLLAGRGVTAEDRLGRPRVAVVNQSAAGLLWPGEEPIGKRLRFGYAGFEQDPPTEVVGVVGDVLYGPPGGEPRPALYTSYLQFTLPSTTYLVRAAGSPAALVPALRRAVAAVDAHLPIHDVRTMEQRAGDALAAERFAAVAVGAFAVLGLLLAAIGIYGIMAYSVAQRRREIGVRLALGATPRGVVRFMVGQGAGLAVVGLVAGGAASVVLARALPALIADVGGADARVLAVVGPLLLGVALLASWLPARRAARIAPAEAITVD